jgi:hypothetical protein
LATITRSIAAFPREHRHGVGSGVFQQVAKGEANVIHKIVATDVRRLWTMTKSE